MRLRHNMDCGGPDVSFGAAGLQQVSVLQSTHRTEGGFDESSCDDGGEVFSREDRAPEVREQWRALRELFKGSTQREAITSAREAAFAAANAACVEAGVRWSRSPSAAVRRCSLHISRVPVSRALVVGRPSDSKHGHASASSASDSLFKERTCPPSPGRSVSASSRTVLDVSLLQRRSEEIHYAEWPALQRALPRGLSLLEEVSYLPLAAAAAAPSEEAGRASGVSRESLAVPRKISVGQGETPSFDPRRPLNQPQLGRLLKRTTFAVLRRGLPKFFDLSLQPLATFVLHALKQRLEGLLSALRPTEGIGGKALEALVVQVREALTASASSMGRASATEILASHRMAERLSLCSGEWGTPGIEKRAFLEGALEVWALEKLNGENAQISYNAALDCWVVCSKRVSLLLPFGAAPSEARASSSPFAASAEAKASGTAEGQGLSLHSGQEAAQQHRRHFVEGEKDSGDLQAQECRGSSEETKPAPASPRGLSSQVGRGILCDRALHARRVAGAWSSLLKTLDEPQVEKLRLALQRKTLVGELLDCPEKQHVVRPASLASAQSRLVFYAVVPHDGSALCWPPAASLALLRSLRLPTAAVRCVLRPRSPLHLLCLLARLQQQMICCRGTEGVVLYVCSESGERTAVPPQPVAEALERKTSQSSPPSGQKEGLEREAMIPRAEASAKDVTFLLKVKAAPYLMRRLLRERLKKLVLSSEWDCTVAAAAECLLPEETTRAAAALASPDQTPFPQNAEQRVAAAAAVRVAWSSWLERSARQFALEASGASECVSPTFTRRLFRARETESALMGGDLPGEGEEPCWDPQPPAALCPESLAQQLAELAEREAVVFRRCLSYAFNLAVATAACSAASTAGAAVSGGGELAEPQQPSGLRCSGLEATPGCASSRDEARLALHALVDFRLQDLLEEATWFVERLEALGIAVFAVAHAPLQQPLSSRSPPGPGTRRCEGQRRKRRVEIGGHDQGRTGGKARCASPEAEAVHLVAEPCSLTLAQLEDLRARALQEGLTLHLHHGLCDCRCWPSSSRAAGRPLVIRWRAAVSARASSSSVEWKDTQIGAAAWLLLRRRGSQSGSVKELAEPPPSAWRREEGCAQQCLGLAFVREDCAVVEKRFPAQASDSASASAPSLLVLRAELEPPLAHARDAEEAASVMALACISECSRRRLNRIRNAPSPSAVCTLLSQREVSARCCRVLESEAEFGTLLECGSPVANEEEWKTVAERFSLLLRSGAGREASARTDWASRSASDLQSSASSAATPGTVPAAQAARNLRPLAVSVVVVLPVGIPGSGKTSTLVQLVRPSLRHALRQDGEQYVGEPTGFTLWKCRPLGAFFQQDDAQQTPLNLHRRQGFSDVVLFTSSDESTGFELQESGFPVQTGHMQRVCLEEAEAAAPGAASLVGRSGLYCKRGDSTQVEKPPYDAFKRANKAAVQRMRRGLDFFFGCSLPSYLHRVAQKLPEEWNLRHDDEVARLRVLVVIDQNHTPQSLPKRSDDLLQLLTRLQRLVQLEMKSTLAFSLAAVVFGPDACSDGSSFLAPQTTSVTPKWNYPWSAAALTLCLHRVFFRDGHPVLGGTGTSSELSQELREVNVCLSFVKLFEGFGADLKASLERIPGLGSVLHVHSILPPLSLELESTETELGKHCVADLGALLAEALDNMRPFGDNLQKNSLYQQILKGVKDISFKKAAAGCEGGIERCAVELQSQLEKLFLSLEGSSVTPLKSSLPREFNYFSDVGSQATCTESLGGGQRPEKDCDGNRRGSRFRKRAVGLSHCSASDCAYTRETLYLPKFIAVDMQGETIVFHGLVQQMHAAVANAKGSPSVPFPLRMVRHLHVTTCFFERTFLKVNEDDKHQAKTWVSDIAKGCEDSARRTRCAPAGAFRHSCRTGCTVCAPLFSPEKALLTSFLACQQQLGMSFRFSVTHIILSSFRGGVLCASVKPLDGACPLPYPSNCPLRNEADSSTSFECPSSRSQVVPDDSKTTSDYRVPLFLSNDRYTHVTLALGGSARAKDSNVVTKTAAAAMQAAVEKEELPRHTPLPFSVCFGDMVDVSFQREALCCLKYASLRRDAVCDGESNEELLFFDGVCVDGEITCMWIWCVRQGDQEVVSGKLEMFDYNGIQLDTSTRTSPLFRK